MHRMGDIYVYYRNTARNVYFPSSQAADYRIYGPLPAGNVVLSVRTPRTRNLLPFPYRGFWQANSDDTWGHYTDLPGKDMTIDSSGVVSAGAGSVSLKYRMVLASNHDGSADFQPPVIVPAGTYTASIRPDYVFRSSGWRPQLEIRAFRVTDTTHELFNTITDYDGNGWTGQITFTVNEPAIVLMSVFYTSSRNFVEDTLYPQLEAAPRTEFEPVNPATLTAITLPRALQEGEYLSFSDQKIMPTGTPVTLPALQTLVGENVLMIENYPRAVNQISVTPADAGINHIRIGETAPSGIYVGETPVRAVYAGENLIYRRG